MKVLFFNKKITYEKKVGNKLIISNINNLDIIPDMVKSIN